MYQAIGAAASTAVDLLSSLMPAKKVTTGVTQASPNPFDLLSSGGATSAQKAGSSSQSGGLSAGTFSALLASLDPTQPQPAPTSKSNALKDLFAQIDGNGDGQITKSEFETALGAGGTNIAAADSVFAKLDTSGDGTVSLKELGSALKGAGGHHHAHKGGGTGGGGSDALMQALDGASNTSSTNSDGSTTTTLTYADGTKLTMSTPAGGAATLSASSRASSSYQLVDQLVEKRAQDLSAAARQSLSIHI